MKRAIFIKYSMIRYYYTEMTLLSVTGGAFYKPLFFEFPNEPAAYENQELNVMLGSALKLGIQSKATNVNTTEFYFPTGLWCDVFNTIDPAENCVESQAGESHNKSSLAYEFYLHLRGGYIAPLQDAEYYNVRTTQDLKKWDVDFHILPLCDFGKCNATGRYLNDDGISVDVKGKQNIYNLTYVGVQGGVLTLTVTMA
jgi:alpha-glucosidase (family GH31 glycosyl hydrolase)